VPSTFSLLLGRVQLEKYDLAALRYITQAGGPMAPALTQRLRQALPHAQLFVMYGQTEATARLTYLPPADLERKLGSVGRPIEGVRLEIRSESGAACGPDEPGEVWVHGPNVMLGYWRDEAATAAAIRDGWLRTGDMGRMDRDGYVFLSGRRSDMIKAGAHRVHPKDVEEVIQELDEVAEVAVAGVDDEMLGQAIKAFVVAAAGRTVDPMSVKAHCRKRLANYKVPKHVEVVAGLPKTASGKVRRHELLQRNSA
jgi:long-chain acyl-CoA synthetase